jgi:hypothetical protein
MKKISLSVRKNILLALALSTSCLFLSHQSHAQKTLAEILLVNSNVDSITTSNPSVSLDAEKNVISVQNNNGTHGITRVYCQSGKKMSESILFAGVNALDIRSLVRGQYIICITLDGGRTFNQKFNKE